MARVRGVGDGTAMAREGAFAAPHDDRRRRKHARRDAHARAEEDPRPLRAVAGEVASRVRTSLVTGSLIDGVVERWSHHGAGPDLQG